MIDINIGAIENLEDEEIQNLISELSKTLAERKKVRYGLTLNLFEKALRELADQYPSEIAIELYDNDYDWRDLLRRYNGTKHTLSELGED